MRWLLSKLQGRTTAFLILFFITGNVAHYLHRLDATYITFMTALLGFVVGHSVKEDIFAQRDSQDKPPCPSPAKQ